MEIFNGFYKRSKIRLGSKLSYSNQARLFFQFNKLFLIFFLISSSISCSNSEAPVENKSDSDSIEVACSCIWKSKKKCDGKGNCEHTFECNGKRYTHSGTKDRAKKLCEIDCCN